MLENNVVISVSGGNVTGVFTNDPNTNVYLVDYDNLATDLSDDCSQGLPAENIDIFCSRVKVECRSFPGIAKLLARLND